MAMRRLIRVRITVELPRSGAWIEPVIEIPAADAGPRIQVDA
jgi:hypothetical protein